MQPSTPGRSARETPDPQGLPYGPLPVRPGQPTPTPTDPVPLDELVDLSWLERAASLDPPDTEQDTDAPADEDALAGEDAPTGENAPAPAASLSLTSPTPEGDDDVHFGVAARALGVSRKTVERMVKRGQLVRGPSNAPATVSKRALVAALEQRRRDVSHLTRATELEKSNATDEWPSPDMPRDSVPAIRQLLVPVLAPLLDEFVAVRTRAAVLESQLDSVNARADQQRTRDELLLALATKGWWGRRRTRKAVLRHYVLGENPPQPDPEID
jgi:hypothetical protein